MARKRRRGSRGMRMGKWVNAGFKIIGLVVAASPAIRGVTEGVQGGNVAEIPRKVAYYYSGVDINSPGQINTGQLTAGAGAIVIGVILSKLGGFLGRRF